MASKEIFYELFNEKVDEFFKDLIESFPTITEFKRFKSGLTLLRNVDPKSPQNIFSVYILSKYKDAFLKKDESVFLNQDIEIISKKKEYWLEFIDQIRMIWKTLDDSNKDIIWKYFHVLVVLSEKCK